MCKVLSNSIQSYKQLTVKGCNEIRFSNGGHLFAIVVNEKNIHVYNFYTYECSEKMQFQDHTQRVMCIDWFHNDMGFSTCGQDGQIYFYDLYTEENESRNRTKDARRPGAKMNSIVNLPGMPYEFLAVGTEKIIFTNTESLKAIPRTSSDPNPTPRLPDLKHHISQLAIHPSGKILFAGVGELDAPYPGAIQVWKLPFEKAAEIQAHAGPITRLRITHSNSHLFSVGSDGMLCIFDVKDRGGADPKRDDAIALGFSEEILSDKGEVDNLQAEENQLKEKAKNQRDHDMEVDIQLNVKTQLASIAEKKNQLVSQR